jgi:ATP phosphoribosyltransferase regulatory subunit
MRDLLPREAERQAALSARVMESFESFGYQRVVLPAFEYADVLERGLGSLEPGAVLRFVEPETGEVVALRPDMTPQVARLLATRLADAPAPARLCYVGSVLRRRRERARQNRQIPQAGVELLGREGPDGDLEILSVAAAAARAAGLADFVIDLGSARIVSSLLDPVPRAHWPRLVEALSLKDTAALLDGAARAGLSAEDLRALSALPDLHGGAETWERAERVLAGTRAVTAVRELRSLWDAALELEVAPKLSVDFGETWDFAYYTGPMFQILAEGPGAPVGSGGRYDRLLERFGAPRAAAGFALDLDHLDWALRSRSAHTVARSRVLVSGDAGAVLRVSAELRRLGIACAPAPAAAPVEYAVAWGYSHVLELADGAASLASLVGSDRSSIKESSPLALATAVAAHVEKATRS